MIYLVVLFGMVVRLPLIGVTPRRAAAHSVGPAPPHSRDTERIGRAGLWSLHRPSALRILVTARPALRPKWTRWPGCRVSQKPTYHLTGRTIMTDSRTTRPADQAETSWEAEEMADEYTSNPTAVRITWEDHDNDEPWQVDMIDSAGRYTEEVSTFATLAEAVARVTHLAQDLEPEKEWVPMTLTQIKAYLAGLLTFPRMLDGYGDATEVRETEHGVEYR